MGGSISHHYTAGLTLHLSFSSSFIFSWRLFQSSYSISVHLVSGREGKGADVSCVGARSPRQVVPGGAETLFRAVM